MPIAHGNTYLGETTMKAIIIFTTIFLTIGCTTPEQRAAQKAQEERDKKIMSLMEKTEALLKQTKETCLSHMSNKLVARKKCFPLLENKTMNFVADKLTDDLGSLTLFGKVKTDRYGGHFRIWCRPGKSLAKKIRKNPEKIQIGGIYSAKGKFVNFSSGNSLTFITLENCQIKKIKTEMDPGEDILKN